MTSPQKNSTQQEALASLCETLDSLNARLERRSGKYACNADGYADRTIRAVTQPLRQVLGAYAEFHRLHTDEQGRIGQQHRQEFFDMIASASEQQGKLTQLCDVDMQRTGTAPGSVMRLSPYFKRMMDHEHVLLCALRQQLKEVIYFDVARLKTMPRHLRLIAPTGNPS